MKLIEKADDYALVPCPLPKCGEPLHLVCTADQCLYASFTEDELRGCRGDDLGQWEVRCEAGHVILLPPDDGAEDHVFGVCRCDPDDIKERGHAEGCAQGDFERLRRLVNGPSIL